MLAAAHGYITEELGLIESKNTNKINPIAAF